MNGALDDLERLVKERLGLFWSAEIQSDGSFVLLLADGKRASPLVLTTLFDLLKEHCTSDTAVPTWLQIEELKEERDHLEEHNAGLQERITDLEDEIEALEERLHQKTTSDTDEE